MSNVWFGYKVIPLKLKSFGFTIIDLLQLNQTGEIAINISITMVVCLFILIASNNKIWINKIDLSAIFSRSKVLLLSSSVMLILIFVLDTDLDKDK